MRHEICYVAVKVEHGTVIMHHGVGESGTVGEVGDEGDGGGSEPSAPRSFRRSFAILSIDLILFSKTGFVRTLKCHPTYINTDLLASE